MADYLERKKKLAENIYDLDSLVYEALGSSLGRVYNGDKNRNLHDIENMMENTNDSIRLREELALISNMANTMESEDEKKAVFAEFDRIILELNEIVETGAKIDIIDANRQAANLLSMEHRFSEKDKRIICISRVYGSAANDIGFAVSNALHMNYYDSRILDEMLKRMDVSKDSVWAKKAYPYHTSGEDQDVYTGEAFEESRRRNIREMLDDFDRYHGLTKEDADFFTQSQLILNIAKKEDCVIMGRCASVILQNNNIPHISIFISAPMDLRVARIMQLSPNMSRHQVQHMLNTMDKQHVKYYKRFTGQQWGNAANYDLTINSASYGIQGAVDLIVKYVK